MAEQDPVEDLVTRACANDRFAFQELLERFRPRLTHQVRARMGARVRSSVEVDDIVQETFLKAIQNLDKLQWQGEEAFASWLGCIAEHLIWKAVQGGARIPLRLDREPADTGTSASRAAMREERLRKLERSLEGLSADHREVIVLARIERLPIEEIARRMSRSPNAVKKLLARALQELRQRFGDTTGSLRLPDRPLDAGGTGHDE